MKFVDREQAGKALGERLAAIPLKNPLLLALPRGGVPVAYEIAHHLGLPLDVLVVRKIGAPGNQEFGIGAVTENNHYWVDPQFLSQNGRYAEEIEYILDHEKAEVARRVERYRKGRSLRSVKGRSVVVVDDGLATGVTARVACAYLKQEGAAEVILAVPVCSPRTAELVRTEIDQLVCLDEPENFYSVGQFYQDFRQLGDAEVVHLLKKAKFEEEHPRADEDVSIPAGNVTLAGRLYLPPDARGCVIFAHGSGSGRFSPRNQSVARDLNAHGLGTLLFDLLSPEENEERGKVFDIPLLGERLLRATDWVRGRYSGPIGYFGASTGAGAALWAAAELHSDIHAVVSRGGRPDLAGERLKDVTAPTLLLVGERDEPVIELNQNALLQMKNAKLEIIAGATHLFPEPGALEEVERKASHWFVGYFAGARRAVA